MTETKEQRAEALNSLSTLCDFFQNRVLKGPSDEALREFNRATKEWVSVTYKELGEKVKIGRERLLIWGLTGETVLRCFCPTV